MSNLKEKIKLIIFGTNTPTGKIFDLILIISIVLSVALVMLDSVAELQQKYGIYFRQMEWAFTLLFTIEYFLRVFTIRRPSSYIFSFFGIIDLLSLVPTYLSLLLPGAQVFSVIRVLRVLRIFRVLKLIQFMGLTFFLYSLVQLTLFTSFDMMNEKALLFSSLACIPILIGLFVGRLLRKIVSENLFKLLFNYMLLLMGLVILVKNIV